MNAIQQSAMSSQLEQDARNWISGFEGEFNMSTVPGVNRSVELCHSMQCKIQNLIADIGKMTTEGEKKEGKLTQYMIEHQRNHVEASQDLRNKQEEFNQIQVIHSGLQQRVVDIDRKLHELNAQIADCERRIDSENRKRENAKQDFIPIWGPFNAMLNGRVPYQAAFEALISEIKKEKQGYESDLRSKQLEQGPLNEELRTFKTSLGNTQIEIGKVESEISSYNSLISQTDQKIKIIGSSLTQLRDTRVHLEKIKTSYRFLNIQNTDLHDFLNAGLLDSSMVIEYHNQVQSIDNVFSNSSLQIIFDDIRSLRPEFKYTTIPTGTQLVVNHRYFSPNQRFFLVYQDDCNLCFYEKGEQELCVWEANTQYQSDSVNMQEDGNLVIHSKEGIPIQSTHTHHRGKELRIADDGVFFIVDGSGKVLFERGKEMPNCLL